MILSNTYNNYVGDIIKLVRSLVIKSTHTINSINSFLTVGGDVLSTDPTQWKYYRNLAGLPYVGTTGYFDDPHMTVYSLDKDMVIPFTYETLVDNPITLAEYRTFGTAYNNLLTLYPDHDMLIRGILNPVDIDVAIVADNYAILNYDRSLLSPGEIHLISDLQAWINNYVMRWDVTAFAVTDPLYAATSFAILIVNLVPAIINLRLRKCKTNEAHEFHIWNYLAGYFNLNIYKDVIPYQQALFLYRNIDYIAANAGKQNTLDFLNDGFAFPFGLQLFNHDIRQDLGNSLALLNAGQYKAISNEVKVNMYPYGTSNQVTDTTKFFTPLEITNKLKNQALLNPVNIEYDTATLINQTLHTPSTEIPTGIIECNIIKTSAVNMVSVASEQIHNWLYLAANGYIRYKYLLTLPSEGVTELDITPGDAAVFLMYASAKYFGTTLTNIYKPRVRDIMYQPPLTEQQLKGLVEPQNLQGTIQYDTGVLKWDRYADVTGAQTLPVNILTVEDFKAYIDRIVNNKIQHLLLPTLETTSLGKDEVRYLIGAFYTNSLCTFVSETTFANFFTRVGVDLSTFSQASLLELITIILKVYVGMVPESDTLQQPYASMVEILRTVSSYMLQFVNGPSTNNIEPLNWELPTVTVPSQSIVDGVVIIHPGVDNRFYVPFVKSEVNSAVIDIKTDVSATTSTVYKSSIFNAIQAGCDISCLIKTTDKAAITPVGAYPKLL